MFSILEYFEKSIRNVSNWFSEYIVKVLCAMIIGDFILDHMIL